MGLPDHLGLYVLCDFLVTPVVRSTVRVLAFALCVCLQKSYRTDLCAASLPGALTARRVVFSLNQGDYVAAVRDFYLSVYFFRKKATSR